MLALGRAVHGGLPERPKGADCKSAGTAYVGSNPSPATYAFAAQARSGPEFSVKRPGHCHIPAFAACLKPLRTPHEPGVCRIVAAMATTDLTSDVFQQTLEDSDILFIDFWADWCGPCKQFAPVYEQVSEQHPDITFGKVDTEAERELAAAAQISSIPTLMAFREKVLVFSQPGALNAEQLTQVVSAVKDLDMEEVHKQVAEQEDGESAQQG